MVASAHFPFADNEPLHLEADRPIEHQYLSRLPLKQSALLPEV